VVAIENWEPLLMACSAIARMTRPGWQPMRGFPNPHEEGADDLFLHRSAHRGIKLNPGGDLLGGVSALQETDLTLSIF